MENNNPDTKENYRESVRRMGKKEFTLLKMQEYGFWPDNLPTPYERQKNETEEDFIERKNLLDEYEKLAKEIAKLYEEKNEINVKLKSLRKEYEQTWDYEKIRKDVAKKIMRESIERRAERKKQKELEKKSRSEAWLKFKSENIVFIGKGYSGGLADKNTDEAKLISLGLPVINNDYELAAFLGLEYKSLRFLTYHRDVVVSDHYHRYSVPKKNGGERNIAAPKPLLKNVQRKILELILEKIKVSDNAHGFLKSKSVVTGANAHIKNPALLIKTDIENFFPTVTFERVRGMFKSFGYSGYVASLLAMLCTYCERIPMEIRGQTKYVRTSGRILPQGSPASPMITNIICRNLDKKMNQLALEYRLSYSRYADDMSFSFRNTPEDIQKVLYKIEAIVNDEGFKINKSKTRYLRNHNRQSVTGVVINNSDIGVTKAWLKNFRAAIYNANKLKAKGKIPSNKINEISGMASWLASVNQYRYRKIINEAKKLFDNLD